MAELRTAATVHVVCDEGLSTFDRGSYRDAAREKQSRGYLRSEVQRLLTQDSIVIVDSLNYIKGYRYELFCLAKGVKTTFAVLHCTTDEDTCRRWNAARPQPRYDDDVLDELCMRFEAPNASNRWDSPLLTYDPSKMTSDQSMTSDLSKLTSDPSKSTSDPSKVTSDPLTLTSDLSRVTSDPSKVTSDPSNDPGEPIGKQVFNALFSRKTLTANQSTQNPPVASAGFLQDLDRVSQEIIQAVFKGQQSALPGDKILIPNCDLSIDFTDRKSMAELVRLKRQFVAYVKTRPALAAEYEQDRTMLYRLFVDFALHNQ